MQTMNDNYGNSISKSITFFEDGKGVIKMNIQFTDQGVFNPLIVFPRRFIFKVQIKCLLKISGRLIKCRTKA